MNLPHMVIRWCSLHRLRRNSKTIAAQTTAAYATKGARDIRRLEAADLPQEIFENLVREGIHVDILVNTPALAFVGSGGRFPSSRMWPLFA